MLTTRHLNHWLGTHYTLDEVSEMDPLLLEVLSAVARGIDPKRED
jgi:hypothetical protein